MARIPQHKRLYNLIKHDILSGTYEVGELLPTEYEFASRHKVARSTVRQALAALEKEGHIEKRQGKGSMVAEGGRKIGLLNIRGFSSVVPNPSNDFLLKPHEINWPDELKPYLTKEQTESNCIFIKRLRRIDTKPIALELTYLPNIGLPDFCSLEFINDSLFETLEKRYLIEIKDVEEDIRAIKPCEEAIKYLKIKKNDPLLSINFKFVTNRSELSIYSTLYCDTSRYSVGNII